MNKYIQHPQLIVDFHGYTTKEVEVILLQYIQEKKYTHIRVITGSAQSRGTAPILRNYVVNFASKHTIRFNRSKREHGGDGALELFFNV